MNKLLLAAIAASMTLSGCAVNLDTKASNFNEASFDLCTTEVQVYSESDDGRIRVICKDGAKFMIQSNEELETLRELNGLFCMTEGLSKYVSTNRSYNFQCAGGEKFSIAK